MQSGKSFGKTGRLVYDHPVLKVREELVSTPRGGSARFVTLVCPDWANIVAVTPGEKMVLIRQFRQGSREMALEIPGGMVDPGETPAEAAARELLEETGYWSEKLVHLGVVNPNPALFGNACHTYLAPDAIQVACPRPEEGEDLEVVLVDRAQVPDLVRRGEITHSLVIAALAFHWLAGEYPAF